jgi:hypothetical protein
LAAADRLRLGAVEAELVGVGRSFVEAICEAADLLEQLTEPESREPEGESEAESEEETEAKTEAKTVREIEGKDVR